MKKLRFIAVVGIVLLCTILSVAASEYTEGDIKQFYSFADYTAARGEGLPNGWSLQSGAVTSPGVGSVQDNERSGNVMKVEGDNVPGTLFGSIFSSGKLRISFDIKQVGDSNFADTTYIKSFRLDINGDAYLDTDNTKKDPTIDDPTVFSKVNGYGHNLFETMNATSEPAERQFITAFEWAHRWMGTRRESDKMFTPEEWHKLEFYIDKDSANQNVYIYMDGEKIAFYNGSTERVISLANNDVTAKLKGLFFTIVKRQMQAGDTGGFLFDNVYIKSYSADELYLDSPEIITDDGLSEGVLRQNGVLNVGFSEYMSRPVTMEDVTITSFQTGEIIENYTIVNADNMQFDICFDSSNLVAGKYIVNVNNVTGKTSGLGVRNTAVFSTEVAYVDGIAVPWVEEITAETYDGSEKTIENAVSTMTDKIKVKFSAPVASADLKNKITIMQGEEIFDYEAVMMEDNNCTAVLVLDTLFAPGVGYSINVASDICAEGTEDVRIMYGYDAEFETADDGAVVVINKTYRTTGRGAGLRGVLELDVLKTTTKVEKYTLFVTAHTDIYDSTLEKNVKKTVALGADTLKFDGEERVKKSCSVSIPINGIGDAELVYYLIGYPDFISINRGTAQ